MSLNTNVEVCNVCRCTSYGNEPANIRASNQCSERFCNEALQRFNGVPEDKIVIEEEPSI